MEFKEFMKAVAEAHGIKTDIRTTPESLLGLVKRKLQKFDSPEDIDRAVTRIMQRERERKTLDRFALGKQTEEAMNTNLENFLKRLFAELGIASSPDVSEDEALGLIKQKLAPLQAQLIDEAVEEGMLAGKLTPTEKDWARSMAAKVGLPVFRAFLKYREKQPTHLIARLGATGGQAVGVQASINEQLGVSPELFAKYNGEGATMYYGEIRPLNGPGKG